MIGKLNKLKRLLNVDDTYIGLHGILDNDPIEDLDIKDVDLELKKKDNLKGIKHINKFQVIVDRDNKDDTIDPPNDFMPSIPFAMYILGVVKAGKTTFMKSVLDLYINAFDETFFISPTHNLDPEAIELLDKYPDIKAFNSLAVLENVLATITKLNKGKSPKDKIKVLIIMDDVINECIKFARKENNFMNRMATNRRHLGISFIMMSQYYKRCPPLLRTNFSSFVLFRQENQAERKKVVDELSGFLGNETFERLFDRATSEPFGALTINFDAPSKELTYTKNFAEIIMTNEDMNRKFTD